MIESTLAAGDLFTAIPNLFENAKLSIAIVALFVGFVAGACALWKGFGSAAGKLLGGICAAAIIMGGVGLALSLGTTVNKYGGNIGTGSVGQYGQ